MWSSDELVWWGSSFLWMNFAVNNVNNSIFERIIYLLWVWFLQVFRLGSWSCVLFRVHFLFFKFGARSTYSMRNFVKWWFLSMIHEVLYWRFHLKGHVSNKKNPHPARPWAGWATPRIHGLFIVARCSCTVLCSLLSYLLVYQQLGTCWWAEFAGRKNPQADSLELDLFFLFGKIGLEICSLVLKSWLLCRCRGNGWYSPALKNRMRDLNKWPPPEKYTWL